MSSNPVIKQCVICGAQFQTIPRSARYCEAHREAGKRIRIERKRSRRLAKALKAGKRGSAA